MSPPGGERVIVEIDEAGEVRIRVEGVAGPSCEDLTADLERHLGQVRPGSRRKTDEWHQPVVRRRRRTQRT